MVKLSPDIGQGEALCFEGLDFLNDQEVLAGVTALAALGALGNDNAREFLFPKAEGVGGHAGAAAHFLYGQCLHVD